MPLINPKLGAVGDCSYGRAGQKRTELIGLRSYKKAFNEGALVLLRNATDVRLSSTRKPCTFPTGLYVPSAPASNAPRGLSRTARLASISFFSV